MNRPSLITGLMVVTLSLGLSACDNSKKIFSKLASCIRDLSVDLTIKSDPTDTVVARFNGGEIRISDLRIQFDGQSPDRKAKFQSPRDNLNLLNSIINQTLLAEAAEKAGFTRDPAIRSTLHRQRTNLLAAAYRAHLMQSEVAVSDADVRQYYNDHLKLMYGPQTDIQASRIVVRTMEDAKKALSLLQSKRPFAEVARTLSTDAKSASEGGRMPTFRLGTGVPAFEKAVLALRDGQISGIIPAKTGFQIARRERITIKPAVPFEAVKQEIHNRLEWQKMDQWLEPQKKLLQLEVDQNQLNAIQFASPPASLSPETLPVKSTPNPTTGTP